MTLSQELAEDEREDATVAKVLPFTWRVEPDARAELLLVRTNGHLARLTVLDADVASLDVDVVIEAALAAALGEALRDRARALEAIG